jgi:hypothetical protein
LEGGGLPLSTMIMTHRRNLSIVYFMHNAALAIHWVPAKSSSGEVFTSVFSMVSLVLWMEVLRKLSS